MTFPQVEKPTTRPDARDGFAARLTGLGQILSAHEPSHACTCSGRRDPLALSLSYKWRMMDAFVLALGACEPGKWRACGSGQPVSVREVIEEAGCLVGRPLSVNLGPPKPESHTVAADSTRIRRNLFGCPHG